jgi:deoxyribodipyrimidine photolyase
MTRAIYWFRNDLRLTDEAALAAASRAPEDMAQEAALRDAGLDDHDVRQSSLLHAP